MCTIVIAKNIFANKPMVVAANRDELLDRPSTLPVCHYGILAPKDVVRGGSWIGVNSHGVIAGLTNRLNVKSVKGRTSRGELVQEALLWWTAEEAYQELKKLSGSSYNGFYMFVADAKSLFYLGGTGKEIEAQQEDDGVLAVSNHGVGRQITKETPKRVINALEAWKQLTPGDASPQELSKVLNVHDSGRYGTCINEPENNYGTKSSSIIHLSTENPGPDWENGPKWDYWHRERSGTQHICQDSFTHQAMKIQEYGPRKGEIS